MVTASGNSTIQMPERLTLLDPPKMEADLNNIAGVVTNGIFARRPADVLLLAGAGGVKTIKA